MNIDKKKILVCVQEIGIGIVKHTQIGPVAEVLTNIADKLKSLSLERRVEAFEEDRSRLKHQIQSRQRLVEKIAKSKISDKELELAMAAIMEASERTYFFEGLFEEGVLEDLKNKPDTFGKLLSPAEIANSDYVKFFFDGENPMMVGFTPEQFRRLLLDRPHRKGLTAFGTEQIAVAVARDFPEKVISLWDYEQFSVTCRLLKPYDPRIESDWTARLRIRKDYMSSVSVIGLEYAYTEIELVWLPFKWPSFVQYPLAKLTNGNIRKNLNWGGIGRMPINTSSLALVKRSDIQWVVVGGRRRLHLKPFGDNNYWTEFEFDSENSANQVDTHIRRIFG